MFLKGLVITDPGEASVCTFIVQVSWGIELQTVLPGDRNLSQYDSFSGKMVLKRLCIGDTGEDSAECSHCSGLLGDRAFRVNVLVLQ